MVNNKAPSLWAVSKNKAAEWQGKTEIKKERRQTERSEERKWNFHMHRLNCVCLHILVSDVISVIILSFLMLYNNVWANCFKIKSICSLQCHRVKVLIPFLLPLCLSAANCTSAFHHAVSQTRENAGQTKTSLNVRRANKARVVTEGSVAAARSGMAHLKTQVIQLPSHWGRKPCFQYQTRKQPCPTSVSSSILCDKTFLIFHVRFSPSTWAHTDVFILVKVDLQDLGPLSDVHMQLCAVLYIAQSLLHTPRD